MVRRERRPPRPRRHPLPTGPLEEPAGGEVVDLRPTASRNRRSALPAAELAISSFGEVAARVAAAGEPHWLIQGLWPADAYGVLAAQEKAGKTWAALDLAVSVATGRPWLDHFACPNPGPVLRQLVTAVAPALLTEPGIGPITAAQLLISWSHPGRFRSEAAFAMLAGAAPSRPPPARSSAIGSTGAGTGS
jgi:AAA domain/Transposase IS116/IS110/IS902 family